MPTIHIRQRHLAAGLTLRTLCRRRDIDRALTGGDLEDAHEKAVESAWTVCPTCVAALGVAANDVPGSRLTVGAGTGQARLLEKNRS